MTGLWFSLGTSVSSINKTDHHDITEILLKVTLNTINPNPSMNVARSFVFQILGDKYLAFDKQGIITLLYQVSSTVSKSALKDGLDGCTDGQQLNKQYDHNDFQVDVPDSIGVSKIYRACTFVCVICYTCDFLFSGNIYIINFLFYNVIMF